MSYWIKYYGGMDKEREDCNPSEMACSGIEVAGIVAFHESPNISKESVF
jgi:hypothetical protein